MVPYRGREKTGGLGPDYWAAVTVPRSVERPEKAGEVQDMTAGPAGLRGRVQPRGSVLVPLSALMPVPPERWL